MKCVKQINSKHGLFNFCDSDLIIGASLREYGEFSEIEYSIMDKFIKDGDIVIDIGANIGCFTIPLSKKVGKKGKVLAFEPQKFIYNLLSDNIKCNKIKNVQIFNNALGEINDYIELNDFDYSLPGNFGGIGLKKNYDNSRCAKMKKNKYKVKTLSLNEFLDLKKCNFLKIDVELMETDILYGGKTFLNKFRPIMWIENHFETPNKINNFLLNNEYDSFWVPTSLFNQDNYFLNTNNFFGKTITTNTLAIPKEFNESFKTRYFEKAINGNFLPTKAFAKTFSDSFLNNF